MLMPKKTKYRKQQRGRMKGKAYKANVISYGECGLYSTEPGILTSRQIEAVRSCINKSLKKGGKIYLRVFPAIPYTKKPLETRMGKGKGNVEDWICKIKPGQVLFEVSGVSMDLAKSALNIAAYKLPVKTNFLTRELI